jgi:hypothetical protein
MRQLGRLWLGRQALAAAPVDHLQVVLPLARRVGKLPLALEGAGCQRGGKALVEPGWSRQIRSTPPSSETL